MASYHQVVFLMAVCGFVVPGLVASCSLDRNGSMSEAIDASAAGGTGADFGVGGQAGSVSGAGGSAGAAAGGDHAGAAGSAGNGGAAGKASGGGAGASLGGSAGTTSGGAAGTGATGAAGSNTGGAGGVVLSYAEVVLADGPIAYWRLGEASGPTAVDATGNGHTGTFKGPCKLGVPGAVGDGDTAVEFDGNATALVVGTAFGFTALAPFSFEAWIRPTSIPTTHRHPFEKDLIDGKGRHGWGVYLHGTLGVGLERFVDNVNYVVNGPVPPIGKYTYVVGTYDGSALNLYMDGAIVPASPVADGRPTIANNATAFVGSAGLFSKVFPGVLDEVAVYDKALSAPTIAAHYAAGTQ